MRISPPTAAQKKPLAAPNFSSDSAAQTEAMLGGGARPGWLGYLDVADVDAAVSAMVADGASVHMPPTNMPGVGRLAMVADPTGAPFYLMKPTPPPDRPDAVSDVFSVDRPHHVRWNELT